MMQTGFSRQWWKAIAVGLVFFFTMGPFTWMFIVSITPETGLFAQGVQYFPRDPTVANYFNIFKVINFGRAFANSVIVAVATTLLAMSVSVLAGYSFARFKFAGRDFLTVSLLLIYMLPSIVLLIPMQKIMLTGWWL